MRNPFFDVLKFLAIMLVVYGHVVGAFRCDFGQPWINNFIVGMNMPLFFMIAGYFAARTIENSDWRKLCKHIYGYFWPVAVVSVIFAALAIALHIPGSEKGFVGYAGRRFLFSPWFLWCLTYCFIATFVCYLPKLRVFRGGAFLLLISVLPFLTRGWYMDDFRSMLPFFVFGAFVLRRCEVWKDWRIGVTCFVIYMLGVWLQGDIGKNGLSFYGKSTTWITFAGDWRPFLQYVLRITNGVVGSVGVMWVLQVLCGKRKLITRLAPLGTTTLWVYILHQWLLDRVVDAGWADATIVCVLMWTGLLFGVSHLCGLAVRFLAEKVFLDAQT